DRVHHSGPDRDLARPSGHRGDAGGDGDGVGGGAADPGRGGGLGAVVKRVYWRPPGVSRRALITIALVALAAFAVVERFPVQTKQPFHEQKLSAARLAQTAFGVIKA